MVPRNSSARLFSLKSSKRDRGRAGVATIAIVRRQNGCVVAPSLEKFPVVAPVLRGKWGRGGDSCDRTQRQEGGRGGEGMVIFIMHGRSRMIT